MLIPPNNPTTNVSNVYVIGNNSDYRTGLGTNTGVTTTLTNLNTPLGEDAQKWTVLAKGTPSAKGFIGINNGKLYAWGTLKECNIGVSNSTQEVVYQRPTLIHSDNDWADCAYQDYTGDAAVSLFMKLDGKIYQSGTVTNGKIEPLVNEPVGYMVDCGGGFQGYVLKNGVLYGFGFNDTNNKNFGEGATLENSKPKITIGGFNYSNQSHINLGEDYGFLSVDEVRERNGNPVIFQKRLLAFGNTIANGSSSTNINESVFNSHGTLDTTNVLWIQPLATTEASLVYGGSDGAELQATGNRDSGATARGTFSGNDSDFIELNTAIINVESFNFYKIGLSNVIGSEGTSYLADIYGRIFYSGSGDANPLGANNVNVFTQLPLDMSNLVDIKGGDRCCFFIMRNNQDPQVATNPVFSGGRNIDYQLGLRQNSDTSVLGWSTVNNADYFSGVYGTAYIHKGNIFFTGETDTGNPNLVGTDFGSKRGFSLVDDSGDWEKMHMARGYVAAIKTDGTLWTLGDNQNGRTAQGTTSGTTVSFTQVGSDTDWAFIDGGDSHLLAIKTNGTLWVAGDVGNWRSGIDPSGGDLDVMTQVGSDTDWELARGGLDSSVAKKTNGTIWSTGHNDNGQTGQGTTSGDTQGLTQIGSDTDWADVAASSNFAFAYKDDGTLYSWGDNSAGATGQGTASGNTLTPTQISGVTDTTDIAVVLIGGAYINGSGELYTWGNNANGNTVQGTTSGTTLSPTQVTSQFNDTLYTKLFTKSYSITAFFVQKSSLN